MTRDEFLTTKVLGECWHDYVYDLPTKHGYVKVKYYDDFTNFSTPEGFFKLWNFCKEQEWWVDFKHWVYPYDLAGMYFHEMPDEYINPDTFADAIARYRGWEGE